MDDEKKKVGLIAAGLIVLGVFLWRTLKVEAEPIVYECPYCPAEFATEEELLHHIEQEHPGVTSKSVEVTGIILGTSTSPYYDGQSPATAVWVQTGEVIPNKGSFYCKSTAVKTDGTSYTSISTRQLTSNAAQLVGIGLPRLNLEYYNLEICDKEGGVTLYNRNWYPEDIVGYY